MKVPTGVNPEISQTANLLSKKGVDMVLSDATSGEGIAAARKIVELTDRHNIVNFQSI